MYKTYYSIDGGETWSIYTEPFNLTESGEVAVQYFSTDKAGNTEAIKEKTILNIYPEATPIGDEEVIIIRLRP